MTGNAPISKGIKLLIYDNKPRGGQGCKAEFPTETMRVPIFLKPAFEQLCSLFRARLWDGSVGELNLSPRQIAIALIDDYLDWRQPPKDPASLARYQELLKFKEWLK